MPTPADANVAIEVLKALPTLLVTLFIGGLTVRVAQEQKRISAQQRDIARRNLNLSLFERRIRVFDATRAAAEVGLNSANPAGKLPDMARFYSDASFLFGPEVRQFMEHELGPILVELETIRAVGQQRGGQGIPGEFSERWFDLRSRLIELTGGGVEKVFSPYLDFSDIR